MKNNPQYQINLINQSINDVKFIKNYIKMPIKGIIKTFEVWVFLYLLSIVPFFILDILSVKLEFYNISWYFGCYRICKILFSIMVPLVLFVYIYKSDISLRERRFLKIWIVFPILFCINQILPTISYYLNTDIMVSIYQSFPFSLFISLISIVYIYSFFKYRFIAITLIVNILYMVFSFIYISLYSQLENVSIYMINIYTFLISLQQYGGVELLSMITIIILIKVLNKNE
ncbi:MAG: hypothetical protein ACLSWB_05595 [Clostridia bacterium]